MAGISPDDSTTSLGKKGSSNRYRSNAPDEGQKLRPAGLRHAIAGAVGVNDHGAISYREVKKQISRRLEKPDVGKAFSVSGTGLKWEIRFEAAGGRPNQIISL